MCAGRAPVHGVPSRVVPANQNHRQVRIAICVVPTNQNHQNRHWSDSMPSCVLEIRISSSCRLDARLLTATRPGQRTRASQGLHPPSPVISLTARRRAALAAGIQPGPPRRRPPPAAAAAGCRRPRQTDPFTALLGPSCVRLPASRALAGSPAQPCTPGALSQRERAP